MKLRVFIVVLALTLAGCVGDKAFFDAQEANWRLIGPQYKAYVQKDRSLTPEQREARLSTAELQDEVLAAHRKVVYGTDY